MKFLNQATMVVELTKMKSFHLLGTESSWILKEKILLKMKNIYSNNEPLNQCCHFINRCTIKKSCMWSTFAHHCKYK